MVDTTTDYWLLTTDYISLLVLDLLCSVIDWPLIGPVAPACFWNAFRWLLLVRTTGMAKLGTLTLWFWVDDELGTDDVVASAPGCAVDMIDNDALFDWLKWIACRSLVLLLLLLLVCCWWWWSWGLCRLACWCCWYTG